MATIAKNALMIIHKMVLTIRCKGHKMTNDLISKTALIEALDNWYKFDDTSRSLHDLIEHDESED